MTSTSQEKTSSRGPIGTLLHCARWLLLIVGLLALAYVGFVIEGTRMYQAEQARELEQASTIDLRNPRPGSVIGKLEIPRLGLETVVVQGDSDSILRHAVGHLPGTALPGQTGNDVLAGHRDTFFRPLRNIRVGDSIVIESPGESHEYKVESTSIVPPTDLSVLRNSGDVQLTLITCYPFSWIGSAPDRFIIRARATTVADSSIQSPGSRQGDTGASLGVYHPAS